jgi:FAD synthase
MHYGPRPVFADTLSCEIYVIDRVITSPPQKLHVSVMNRIRDIKSFPLSGMLEEQIKSDIDVAKRILS